MMKINSKPTSQSLEKKALNSFIKYLNAPLKKDHSGKPQTRAKLFNEFKWGNQVINLSTCDNFIMNEAQRKEVDTELSSVAKYLANEAQTLEYYLSQLCKIVAHRYPLNKIEYKYNKNTHNINLIFKI